MIKIKLKKPRRGSPRTWCPRGRRQNCRPSCKPLCTPSPEKQSVMLVLLLSLLPNKRKSLKKRPFPFSALKARLLVHLGTTWGNEEVTFTHTFFCASPLSLPSALLQKRTKTRLDQVFLGLLPDHKMWHKKILSASFTQKKKRWISRLSPFLYRWHNELLSAK